MSKRLALAALATLPIAFASLDYEDAGQRHASDRDAGQAEPEQPFRHRPAGPGGLDPQHGDQLLVGDSAMTTVG